MAGWWRTAQEALDAADQLVGVRPIARRYFAMNAFDGIVTTIGVVMGCMVAGIQESSVVLVTGLATSIAMGISGFWGAYLTEAAERKRSLDDLQQQTLTDLTETSVARASKLAVFVVTAVDGLSPFLGAVLVLTPFLGASWVEDVSVVYYASFATSLVTLFGLGAYLGRVSHSRMLPYAVKTCLAGGVALTVGYLLHLLPVAGPG